MLNDKTRIFVYESGDHGNTSLRYGFTVAACKNQDTRGHFYMIGVVQAKETYEIIKKPLSPGIMKETELLKNSQVIEVTAKGGETRIIDRTICLVDKNITSQLYSRGKVTLHKQDADSDVFTSITLTLGYDSVTLQLYRPLPSKFGNVDCSISFTNHNLYTLCTGDLVFIATIFGKDGMSHYWCPHCQLTKKDWSEKTPSKEVVQDNIWTDNLMEEKLQGYLVKKGNNKSCRGALGVNNEKLWTYSVDDIVPPVLHIPLGLIQVLWDDLEDFIKSISNVSDAERNIRENVVLLGEKDRTFSSKQKSYTQRTKELTNELKDAQREFDNLNIGTPEYFEAIEVMNEIATLKAELSRYQELEKKLKERGVS